MPCTIDALCAYVWQVGDSEMKRLSLIALLVSTWIAVAGALAAPNGRVVSGKVIDRQNHPVAQATVYLKDLKKLTIKSFISTSDGSFRLAQLPLDTDYEVWADYKGRKSVTNTVSSFDTKKVIIVTLQIK